MAAAVAAAIAVPATAHGAGAESEAAPAACQHHGQPLGFGLTGTIEITLCPEGSTDYEVLVKTTNTAIAPLYGFTRITGSDGTYYRGEWHRHGGGTSPFNEGLRIDPGVPAGTQYCGQFFQQASASAPVTEFSTPVCLSLP
ncbi:MAG: hypothetical protein LC635_06015 [Pseudonocardiaceae bacterium]|nr:hypothetical protein [Pseudonocardiaceae bacterium]